VGIISAAERNSIWKRRKRGGEDPLIEDPFTGYRLDDGNGVTTAVLSLQHGRGRADGAKTRAGRKLRATAENAG